jgi:hypothetical protein
MNVRSPRSIAAACLFGGAAVVLGCVGDDPSTNPSDGTSSSSGGSSGTSSSGASSSGTSSSGTSSSGASSSGASSSGTSGDAGPTFTPKDLPFDGNAKLTTWEDQSGNGHNAGTTGCTAPPAKAANSLNNLTTIAFDGTSSTCMTVPDAVGLRVGAGDFAVFVVARYTTTGSSPPSAAGTFWFKRLAESNPKPGIMLIGNVPASTSIWLWQNQNTGNSVGGATMGLNDNNFRRLGGTRRGNDLEVWVNGNSDGKLTVAAVIDDSTETRDVYIGAHPDSTGGFLTGNIAEIVFVKGSISNTDIGKLDAYFKAKWAL